ncbi:uncharacterized protein FIBRA_08831 [Fibroporia radiculosa]|uniref:Uncharacterized protein n=1 Tax=Fibroporia radiculosa TaxID=599839 RepID=J4ICK2_9APHY|nr:uncharacterized protein FIBRA_08831 [Fibroporia radiculosa]CCM06556.1 predicted protein [Fibroporia radiculosa]
MVPYGAVRVKGFKSDNTAYEFNTFSHPEAVREPLSRVRLGTDPDPSRTGPRGRDGTRGR